MTTSVTLFIPGLFQQLSERETPDCPPLPSLERLLARASRSRFGNQHDKDACLTRLFGIDNGEPPPTAALSWLADNHDASATSTDTGSDAFTGSPHPCWLRADPVHLRPDRDRLLLFDASQLQITAAETQALAETLGEFFAEDGITLHTPQPQRWYLRLPNPPTLQTSALERVSGRDILPYMPAGDDGPYWRQRLNEVQMLLYQHPVNERREQRGQATINSLWFWGNGALPVAPTARYTQVFSDDPIAQGLARLSATCCDSHLPSPNSLSDGSAMPGGASLLQYSAVHSAQTLGDAAAWQDALQQLQLTLLDPLMTALEQRHIDTLTLLAANGLQYRASRRTLGRWWRRSRPYSSYLKTARDTSS